MKIVDFDEALPKELRAALRETEVCSRFLAARERAGALAESILRDGGTLHDVRLVKEAERVEKMADALERTIRENAYTQFYKEEIGEQKSATDITR